MYQQNAAHTGFVNTSLDVNQFQFEWQAMIGDGVPVDPMEPTILQIPWINPRSIMALSIYMVSNVGV